MVPCPSALRRVREVPARGARSGRAGRDPSAGCSVVPPAWASARGGRARRGRKRPRAPRHDRVRPPPPGDPERRTSHTRPLGEAAAGRAARGTPRAGDGGGHCGESPRAADDRAASLPPACRTRSPRRAYAVHPVRRRRDQDRAGVHVRRRSRVECRGGPPRGRDRGAGRRGRARRIARRPRSCPLLRRRRRRRIGRGTARPRASRGRATAGRPRGGPVDARARRRRPRASRCRPRPRREGEGAGRCDSQQPELARRCRLHHERLRPHGGRQARRSGARACRPPSGSFATSCRPFIMRGCCCSWLRSAVAAVT